MAVKSPQRRQQIKRQARKARREAKAQQRFIGLHTPKQANRVASAEARAEYQPVIRGLRSEARASRKRQGELGQQYGQLTADIGGNIDRAAQTYAQQQAEITKRLADAGGADRTSSAGLSAQDAATAALLGGPTDQRGAELRAAAAQALAQQRVSMNAPLAAEGANFIHYLGGRKVSARERGIESGKAESDRRRKIKEDIRAAKKERGQKKVANLETLRGGDRDFSVQQTVAGGKEGYNRAIEKQAKLGYKGDVVTAQAQVAAAQAYSRARERGASAQEATAAANLAGSRVKAHAQENTAKIYGKNSGKKDKGGYSVREALGLLREGFKNGQRITASQAVDYLVNRGVDVSVAKAAVRRQSGGGGKPGPVH